MYQNFELQTTSSTTNSGFNGDGVVLINPIRRAQSESPKQFIRRNRLAAAEHTAEQRSEKARQIVLDIECMLGRFLLDYLRGWCGTLKRVMWYFEDGGVGL